MAVSKTGWGSLSALRQLSPVQRAILWGYVVVVLGLCLYVPNRYSSGRITYSLLLFPPVGTAIDNTRLALEIVIVTVLAGVAFVIGDAVWKGVGGAVWKAVTIKRIGVVGLTVILLALLLAIWYQERTFALYDCLSKTVANMCNQTEREAEIENITKQLKSLRHVKQTELPRTSGMAYPQFFSLTPQEREQAQREETEAFRQDLYARLGELPKSDESTHDLLSRFFAQEKKEKELENRLEYLEGQLQQKQETCASVTEHLNQAKANLGGMSLWSANQYLQKAAHSAYWLENKAVCTP